MTTETPVDVAPETVPLKDTETLEILQIIKEAQSQHGLKHGDYNRYRGYCSRRLRRVRKSVGFVSASAAGKNRQVFCKKGVSNDLVVQAAQQGKDACKYLYIPLMCAERCWAYAMALKQEANTEPRKKFHLMRKLKKAVVYAKELRKLCNDEPSICDARAKLESQAYCAYLTGIYSFESEQWTEASIQLKNAQAIYNKLITATVDDDCKQIYQTKIDELKPTLRYCAFNIGEQGIEAQDLIKTMKSSGNEYEDEFLSSKLDQLISLTREKQSATLSEITWLGKTIAVKHEKIRSFLLSLQEFKNLENPKITELEKNLFECRDCIQLLRDAGQDKTSLHCYLLYVRLDLTCRRNLILISNITNQSELVRPYEVLIGTLNDIATLPLEHYLGADADYEPFLEEIKAKTLAYKAFRCYYIGKLDKLTWKESAALLNQSVNYCHECLSNPSLDKKMKEDIKQLLNNAESEKFTIAANNFSEGEQKKLVPGDSKINKKPLIDRLNEYLDETEIRSESFKYANFPPQFEPVPCEPIFIDLAYKRLKFPSLEDESQTKAGGITGFVKGLFWRK